jgi:hypothetical protein
VKIKILSVIALFFLPFIASATFSLQSTTETEFIIVSDTPQEVGSSFILSQCRIGTGQYACADYTFTWADEYTTTGDSYCGISSGGEISPMQFFSNSPYMNFYFWCLNDNTSVTFTNPYFFGIIDDIISLIDSLPWASVFSLIIMVVMIFWLVYLLLDNRRFDRKIKRMTEDNAYDWMEIKRRQDDLKRRGIL